MPLRLAGELESEAFSCHSCTCASEVTLQHFSFSLSLSLDVAAMSPEEHRLCDLDDSSFCPLHLSVKPPSPKSPLNRYDSFHRRSEARRAQCVIRG